MPALLAQRVFGLKQESQGSLTSAGVKPQVVTVTVRVPKALKKRLDLQLVRAEKTLQDWLIETIEEKLLREANDE